MIQTEMDALAAIDVFSLKVLFFQYRPRDGTLEELFSFFQISSYARTSMCPCMHNEKTKGKFPGEHHVVWIGKTKHTR